MHRCSFIQLEGGRNSSCEVVGKDSSSVYASGKGKGGKKNYQTILLIGTDVDFSKPHILSL